MGIQALIRPQTPKFEQGSKTKPFYSLTSASNAPDQWGYIPKLYGRMRILPPLGGLTYTHADDGEQYLHVLLCLGYGPLRIGDTGPIVGDPTGRPNSGIVKLVTSRDDNTRDQIITNVRVGDATLESLANDLWNDADRAAVRYQIGTVDAILNPGAFVSGERAIYNTDVSESILNRTIESGAELGYSDNDNEWVDDISFDTQAFTLAEGAVYCTFDLEFPAFYVMAGQKNVSEGAAASVYIVDYRRENLGAWQPAVLAKNTDKLQASIYVPAPPRIKGTDKWMIHTTERSMFRRTNGFPIMEYNYTTQQWEDYAGAIPEGTKHVVRVRRWASLRVKHTVLVQNSTTWASVRAMINAPAWVLSEHHNLSDVVLMALQIKASGRVSGSLEPITLLACSAIYNQIAYGPTNNPAQIFSDVLTGTHLQPANRLSSDQVDWTTLSEWANFCAGLYTLDSKVYTFDYYYQDNETIFERMRTIATTGKAAWTFNGSKVSVVRDNQFTPVQLVSPRNSRNFELTKNYPKVPHALRVRYVRPDTWEQNELLVLDDGYMQRVGNFWYNHLGQKLETPNLAQPSLYEVLETKGVTNRKQAFREGRYFLAAMRLRREVYKFEMDIENIVATRGDCVYLSQDAMVLGRASGRVLSVAGDVLYLDEPVTFEYSKDFCVYVRSLDGASVPTIRKTIRVINPNHNSQVMSVQCSTPGQFAGIDAGDLFVFGVVDSETILAKITQIDYQPDLSAVITAVHAATELLNSDTQDIHEDFPGGEADDTPETRPPPMPLFVSFVSKPTDLYIGTDGNVYAKVHATWSIPQSATRVDTVLVHYQYGPNPWQTVEVDASLGIGTVSGIPRNTLVQAYLQGHNTFSGRYSNATDPKYVSTPDMDPYLPVAPNNLHLAVEATQPPNLVNPVYWIRADWNIPGFSADVEIRWSTLANANINPNPDHSSWNGKNLGAGEVQYIIGADVLEQDEIKAGLAGTDYVVAVRNKVWDHAWDNISPWSNWTRGNIFVAVYDGPPPQPEGLNLYAFKGYIKVEWDLRALPESAQAVEIWYSRFNDRTGNTSYPPKPAATLAASVDITPENTNEAGVGHYNHYVTDKGYYYYWIRIRSITGVHSKWYPEISTDGRFVYYGVSGDGAPPPDPEPLADSLTPDSWQITVKWAQKREIPDLAGTVIYACLNMSETEPTTGDSVLGVTDKLTLTHMRLNMDERWHYWAKNVDVEGLSSNKVYLGSAVVPKDAGKFEELFRVDKLTAETIDTRGLTIKTEGTTENPLGEIIFGAGSVPRPTWLSSNLVPTGMVDAFIRKGAILEAYVGGDETNPGFIQNFTFLEEYEDPDHHRVAGSGWKIDKNGSAIFHNIRARGTMASAYYVAGSTGWLIDESGNAEFNDLAARGTVSSFTYTPGSVGWQVKNDGTAEFNSLVARGTMSSSGYIPGVQGWRIDANGNVEFHSGWLRADLVVSGTMHADRISSGSIASTSVASSSASSSGAGYRALYANQVWIGPEHAGRDCVITAHVSVETSIYTDYIEFYVENFFNPRVLYDKTNGGQLDSRFYSTTDAWVVTLPASGAYNVYVKVHHKAGGGTSSDPKVVFIFQRR